MLPKLVFATNNQHKITEVAAVLQGQFEIVSLESIGCFEDIEETGSTLNENATIKSRYVDTNYGLDCFGDDSGLEIESLNGEPGVYSARYSGERDFVKNMDLVLSKMQGQENRKARFRTVISLILNGVEHQFEGIVDGTIRHKATGTGGFGYDPIFQPDGYNITFAEMSLDQKSEMSHRAKAMQQLIAFLKQVNN